MDDAFFLLHGTQSIAAWRPPLGEGSTDDFMPCAGFSDAQLAREGLLATPDGLRAYLDKNYLGPSRRVFVSMPDYMRSRGYNPPAVQLPQAAAAAVCKAGPEVVDNAGDGGDGGSGASGVGSPDAAVSTLNQVVKGPVASFSRVLNRCALLAALGTLPEALALPLMQRAYPPFFARSSKQPVLFIIVLLFLVVLGLTYRYMSAIHAPELRSRASETQEQTLGKLTAHGMELLAKTPNRGSLYVDASAHSDVGIEHSLRVRVGFGADGGVGSENADSCTASFPLSQFDTNPIDGALSWNEADHALSQLSDDASRLPIHLKCTWQRGRSAECFGASAGSDLVLQPVEYSAWLACVMKVSLAGAATCQSAMCGM
jgi:hypothetical protein